MSLCVCCGKPKAATSKFFCSRNCYFASNKGSRNPAWKGENVHFFAGNDRARAMYPLEPCEICGSEKSERHHIDGNSMNNERSNIQFLCRKHHMQIDGRLTGISLSGHRIGEGVSNSKLTEIEVVEIRYKSISATDIELGKTYGVHRNTIRRIRTGETWKHLLVRD